MALPFLAVTQSSKKLYHLDPLLIATAAKAAAKINLSLLKLLSKPASQVKSIIDSIKSILMKQLR